MSNRIRSSAILIVTCLLHVAWAENVIVQSTVEDWQDSGIAVEPNATYAIVPDPARKVTLNNLQPDPIYHDYAGGETALEHAGRGKLPESSLICLVFQHVADGSPIPHVFSIPRNKSYAQVVFGQHGGSIHFAVQDKVGCFGDNAGSFLVRVEKSDGSGHAFRPFLPVTRSDGHTTWTIHPNGEVEATMKYSVAAAVAGGDLDFYSGMAIRFNDGGGVLSYRCEEHRVRPNAGETKHYTISKKGFDPIAPERLKHLSVVVVESSTSAQSDFEKLLGYLEKWNDEAVKIINDEVIQAAVKILAK